MTRSRKSAVAVAATFVALLAGKNLRAGDVASNDELPPIDTDNAVRFTVPAAYRPSVKYNVTVKFAGDNEQNVDLYVWAADTNDTGHWQRRSFFNSYWQGAEINAALTLESGRSYLLLQHQKSAPSPAYGLPWTQAKLAPATPAGDAADPLPTIRGEFPQTANASTTITLQPATPTPVPEK